MAFEYRDLVQKASEDVRALLPATSHWQSIASQIDRNSKYLIKVDFDEMYFEVSSEGRSVSISLPFSRRTQSGALPRPSDEFRHGFHRLAYQECPGRRGLERSPPPSFRGRGRFQFVFGVRCGGLR